MSMLSPIEWLRKIEEDPEREYGSLLRESGSLAIAAHRVAKARCETWTVPSRVPTSFDVRAAASEIVRRLKLAIEAPPRVALLRDCEALGLHVL